MNAWALNKDKAIKLLLIAIEARFGEGILSLSPQWASDTQAVGLFQAGEDEVLAYVHIHGETPGHYALHLEYPGVPASSSNIGENLDLPHLLDLLAVHFNLADRPTL
jgi:hypothetical protein